MKTLAIDINTGTEPISDYALMVDDYLSLCHRVATMQADLEAFKHDFRKLAAEHIGPANKSATFAATDGRQVRVSHNPRLGRFKSTDKSAMGRLNALRLEMGDAVEELFEESLEAKVKPSKVDALLLLCQEHNINLKEYFTLVKVIVPVRDFLAKAPECAVKALKAADIVTTAMEGGGGYE